MATGAWAGSPGTPTAARSRSRPTSAPRPTSRRSRRSGRSTSTPGRGRSGRARRSCSTRAGGAARPAYSPDGRWLAAIGILDAVATRRRVPGPADRTGRRFAAGARRHPRARPALGQLRRHRPHRLDGERSHGADVDRRDQHRRRGDRPRAGTPRAVDDRRPDRHGGDRADRRASRCHRAVGRRRDAHDRRGARQRCARAGRAAGHARRARAWT